MGRVKGGGKVDGDVAEDTTSCTDPAGPTRERLAKVTSPNWTRSTVRPERLTAAGRDEPGARMERFKMEQESATWTFPAASRVAIVKEKGAPTRILWVRAGKEEEEAEEELVAEIIRSPIARLELQIRAVDRTVRFAIAVMALAEMGSDEGNHVLEMGFQIVKLAFGTPAESSSKWPATTRASGRHIMRE